MTSSLTTEPAQGRVGVRPVTQALIAGLPVDGRAGTFDVTSPQDGRLEVEQIRKHVFPLPDDYEIHPGHGPSSTVVVERRYNPFFV